jgi:hypothetical protein
MLTPDLSSSLVFPDAPTLLFGFMSATAATPIPA